MATISSWYSLTFKSIRALRSKFGSPISKSFLMRPLIYPQWCSPSLSVLRAFTTGIASLKVLTSILSFSAIGFGSRFFSILMQLLENSSESFIIFSVSMLVKEVLYHSSLYFYHLSRFLHMRHLKLYCSLHSSRFSKTVG